MYIDIVTINLNVWVQILASSHINVILAVWSWAGE